MVLFLLLFVSTYHEKLFKLSTEYLSDHKMIEPSDELAGEVFKFREYVIDGLV